MIEVLLASMVFAATTGVGAFYADRAGRRRPRRTRREPMPLIVHDEDDHAAGSLTWDCDVGLFATPTRSIAVLHGGCTDRGLVRAANEDAILCDASRGLFAVADGMGGHRGGAVASRTAIEALEGAIADGPCPESPADAASALTRAFESSHTKVFDRGERDAALEGMGTTLVALHVDVARDLALVANVGDSRCYRLRDGALAQLTSDHVATIDGVASQMLTRAIGPSPSCPAPDIGVHRVREGDVFMLCSDGLGKMVDDATIRDVLSSTRDPESAARALVDLANARGGIDNTSVVVVRVVSRRA